MRIRAAAFVVGVAAWGLLGSCFAPTYSDCAFRCGTQAPLCPDEYECRADGYCHLHTSAVSCAPAPGDLGAASDASFDAAAAD